jgi:hypothetical protein
MGPVRWWLRPIIAPFMPSTATLMRCLRAITTPPITITLMSRYFSVPLNAHVVDIARAGQHLVEALLLQLQAPSAPKTKLLLQATFMRFE